MDFEDLTFGDMKTLILGQQTLIMIMVARLGGEVIITKEQRDMFLLDEDQFLDEFVAPDGSFMKMTLEQAP